ncbi:MAG TPA: DNA methylase [Candidatus Avilachnospira avistercoris]|nr:DNA methylase [Candidatus Avilachnospira avistercoris]
MGRTYIAIDLKSFYASVECVERGLDPFKANLVVADAERTEKTICLAVSPALKAFGVPGRPRLFEVIEQVRKLNADRAMRLCGRLFSGRSYDREELLSDPEKAVDFITAPPQMGLYIEKSTQIYEIYLKYIAPEDIYVYSVDEVFIDATPYLRRYGLDARGLAMKLIREVIAATGITATAGIGTNLYLCKVAMDIVAKHMEADRDGVRIAELDELSYRRLLWNHRPLTDFWRIGRGYERRLASQGLYTMGDIAACSLGGIHDYHNEELLYKLFGVNAEFLIDHAWGRESCSLKDIKAYVPRERSFSEGQVLKRPYSFSEGRTVVCEMADAMALRLFEQRLLTDQIVLNVEYDIENFKDRDRLRNYKGEIRTDRFGHPVPVHAHGSLSFERPTYSMRDIGRAVGRIFDERVDRELSIRRIYLNSNHIIPEAEQKSRASYRQLTLFDKAEAEPDGYYTKEKRLQEALLSIKRRYGGNAVLRGISFCEGATGRERNMQIGGHRA